MSAQGPHPSKSEIETILQQAGRLKEVYATTGGEVMDDALALRTLSFVFGKSRAGDLCDRLANELERDAQQQSDGIRFEHTPRDAQVPVDAALSNLRLHLLEEIGDDRVVTEATELAAYYFRDLVTSGEMVTADTLDAVRAHLDRMKGHVRSGARSLLHMVLITRDITRPPLPAGH